MSDGATPAAGWYPDPHDATQNRFWDGSQWTDAFAPRPGAYPPGPAAASPPPPATSPEPPVSDAWARTPPAQTPSSQSWPPAPVGASAWSGSAPTNGPAWSQAPSGGSALPDYYTRAFATIDAGQTKVVWNWPAFLLGAFWYLYRGMWAKALIYAAIAILSSGVLLIPLWIYGGLMGTYDLWLLHRKGTQTW